MQTQSHNVEDDNFRPVAGERHFSLDEIAEELEVSRSSVERKIAAGELRAFKNGHYTRISERELTRYYQTRPEYKPQTRATANG